MTEFFFFKQKTAYEMRISDWSSDVCSSDLYSARSIGGRDEMQGTCVRMNDGIDLTVYAQNEMRILGEDIDGTLAMPNRPLSGRIIMAYGACQGTGRRYFAAVRPSPTSPAGRRNYRDGADRKGVG